MLSLVRDVFLEISCSAESAGVVKIKELILFIFLRQPSLCLSTNTWIFCTTSLQYKHSSLTSTAYIWHFYWNDVLPNFWCSSDATLEALKENLWTNGGLQSGPSLYSTTLTCLRKHFCRIICSAMVVWQPFKLRFLLIKAMCVSVFLSSLKNYAALHD